jgi:hypothetical protein
LQNTPPKKLLQYGFKTKNIKISSTLTHDAHKSSCAAVLLLLLLPPPPLWYRRRHHHRRMFESAAGSNGATRCTNLC